MKYVNFKILRSALFALFLLASLPRVSAQTAVCAGEQIVFTLAGYHGSIQWQFSSTGSSGPFSSVSGLIGDSAAYIPNMSGWFRAEIISGTCSPVYSDTLEVIVNPVPTANAGGNQNACTSTGANLGGIPTASGGTGPYSYAWTPTAGLSNPTDPNPNANPASTTTYNLVVTDANGCTATDNAIVTPVLAPSANAGPDQSISCGASTSLAGSGSGGTAPYTYAWTPSTGLSDPTITNPTATPSGTTTYVLNVTDVNGCSGADSVTLTVAGGGTGTLTFSYSGSIDTSFVVPCNGSVTIEAWGAEGGYNTSSGVMPGMGAYQKGTFAITPGTRLKILVGEKPSSGSGNGGGGGTFVALTNNTPLIVAGGGGGSAQTTDSPNKHGQAGQSGGTGAAGGGVGGSGGSGGSIGASGFQSGAGGGFNTDGANGWTTSTGGLAFVNGGSGGTANGTARGGFGGGGSGSSYVVGGGGGGYSGGGSGGNSTAGVGGGGGSYNNGTNTTSTAGVRAGHGQVIISW